MAREKGLEGRSRAWPTPGPAGPWVTRHCSPAPPTSRAQPKPHFTFPPHSLCGDPTGDNFSVPF